MKKQIISICLLLAMIMSLSSLFVMPVVAQDASYEVQAAPVAPGSLVGWDGAEIDTSWYEEGASSFTISTPAALAGLSSLVNAGNTFAGATIYLGADINLNNQAWTAIGTSATPFSGTFDGQGHTIFGLSKQALFCYIDAAIIQNVTITGDVNMSSMSNTSPFFLSTLVDSKVTHVASAVVGHAYNSDVKYVSNYANVTFNQSSAETKLHILCGGVIGYGLNSTIQNCQNFGVVQSYNNRNGGNCNAMVGGIVGA